MTSNPLLSLDVILLRITRSENTSYSLARQANVSSVNTNSPRKISCSSICFASVSRSGRSPSYFSLLVRWVGEGRIRIKGEGENGGRNKGRTYSSTWLQNHQCERRENTASAEMAPFPLIHARTNSSISLIVFLRPLRSLCARNNC